MRLSVMFVRIREDIREDDSDAARPLREFVDVDVLGVEKSKATGNMPLLNAQWEQQIAWDDNDEEADADDDDEIDDSAFVDVEGAGEVSRPDAHGKEEDSPGWEDVEWVDGEDTEKEGKKKMEGELKKEAKEAKNDSMEFEMAMKVTPKESPSSVEKKEDNDEPREKKSDGKEKDNAGMDVDGEKEGNEKGTMATREATCHSSLKPYLSALIPKRR